MSHLVTVERPEDIFPQYQETPIGRLLEYQNLNRPLENFDNAQLLIGMCMDNRKSLRIPDNFAYIIRSGGGNLRYSEFKVSYAVAIGGIKTIALIGHNECGMANLFEKKEQFIQGLVANGGWNREWAEEHFFQFAPIFEIGNSIDFVLCEASRLRLRYPKILVAPMYYSIESNLLHLIREDWQFTKKSGRPE